jgi:porin
MAAQGPLCTEAEMIYRLLLSILVSTLLLTQVVNAQETSIYDDIPEFGGPSSVGVGLKDDNKTPLTGDFIKDGMSGWFGTKQEIMEKHGLAYGLNLSTLYQSASAALGEDDAWGGIIQLPASWTVLNRGGKNTGTIVFKAENRSKISTDLAPQDLGIQGIGAASIVGTQFGDKDWIITNLFWQQALSEGRTKFVVGQIDNTDFMDVYGLINPQTAFMNLSFSTNPTIGVPDQGFGGGFGTLLGNNFYLVASLMDAAGDPGHASKSIDQFFDNNEYFKHIEIGYTSSPDRIYFDNIHFVYWESDEQTKSTGESKGSGWTFSYAKFINDKYMPFLRIGDSDGGGGALLEKMVTAGLGIYYGETNELFGVGLSYGEASEDPVGGFGSDLDPQYTGEIFYRFQLSQHLAITPDLQIIVDPVLNPAESSIFVVGVRARLSL